MAATMADQTGPSMAPHWGSGARPLVGVPVHRDGLRRPPPDGACFGIRLAGGVTLPGPDYNEWDCLADAEHEGLITSVGHSAAGGATPAQG